MMGILYVISQFLIRLASSLLAGCLEEYLCRIPHVNTDNVLKESL